MDRPCPSLNKSNDNGPETMLGKPPLDYVQSLCVERAVYLLKTTKASIDENAERVGCQDGGIFRTLLRRKLGLGLKEIRRAC